MKKKFLYSLSVTLTTLLLTACVDNNSSSNSSEKDSSPSVEVNHNYFEAEYNLTSANLDGEDVTSDYIMYVINFYEDGNMRVFINQNNTFVNRNSTYEYDGSSKIIETYEGFTSATYEYTLLGDYLITYVEDYAGTTELVFERKKVEDIIAGVDFQSVLFGEDVSLTKFYNYCPAIIVDETDDGKQRMNIWYCTNKDTGVIVDYIGFRQGILNENNRWEFSDETIVLEPTEGTWDARHTCDPSVVKGEFEYQEENYNYLMAYLGCTTEDYQKNETGIAVAKNIEGPWVKINTANPIVPWYDNGNIDEEQKRYENMQGTTSIYWGTGMPSLLSVDNKGEVIMFYQSTKQVTGIRRFDFSDLDNPVEKYCTSLTSNGILNSAGSRCNIGIPDFAYDPVKDRLYVVSVTNERNPADVTKTLVNSHSMVAYVEGLKDMEEVSDALQSRNYKWNMVGYVGPNETGWERNHNPGLVKTADALIPNSEKIDVVVSTGHNSWANENIFTYRLFGWSFEIE